jgi:hypothetical protein
MPLRDGVLLLLALVPGLVEDDAARDLIAFLRDGSAPGVATSATVRWDGAQVLAAPNATSAVTGTLAGGVTVQVWRALGDWRFISDDSLAGWVQATWLVAG